MSTVDVSGPLFDGRADLVMDECVVDVRHAVGDQGYSNVMGILESRIRALEDMTEIYERFATDVRAKL